MSNLQYGLEIAERDARIFVDVPTDLAASMQRENPALTEELESLSRPKNRVLEIEPHEGMVRVRLNADRIGLKKDDHQQRLLAHRTATIFSSIDSLSADRRDSGLSVQMSDQFTSDGRLRMHAEVAWPERATDKQASDFMTGVMQGIAYQLKYERRLVSELVGAQVIRERGVSLETNPLGSCNIGAGGYLYFPERPTVELHQHNIYSPIQQLICFAGAIAMARVDEHLEAQSVATE